MNDRIGVLAAVMCAWLSRVGAAVRFRQPWDSALLTAVGVSLLLVIQWCALFRSWFGKPAEWKGRSYGASGGAMAQGRPPEDES